MKSKLTGLIGAAAMVMASAIAAQAQHVLGVAVPRTVARNRLHGEEREPSFAAQALHDVDGGDIDVTFGTAVMRFAGEDRRDVPIKRLVIQRLAPADLM